MSALDRVRAEVGRVHLASPPPRLPDRGADGVDDVGLGHRCSSSVGLQDRARDAAAVKGGVAPAAGERPRPLQVQVQVVLGRVADRAVALQRAPRPRARRRRRRAPWPSRRATRASGSPSASEYAARYTSGRANSSAMRASARWCFTAWNEPIGTPNCWRSFTYSTVISSMRSAEPAQLRGGAAHAAVEARASTAPASIGVGRRRCTSNSRRAPSTDGCGDERRPSSRIEPAGGGDDDVGGVGPRHERVRRRATVTSARPSSGTPNAAVSTIGSGTA